MTLRRSAIPLSTEQEVLFRAHHTCSICRVPGKDVQIHHIDSQPDNNIPGNLIVVCLDCHSRITGKRGLGKAYTPGEVRRYKNSWERQVLDSRRVQRPVLKYQKELVSQIDLIICDILASEKDIPRVKRLLGVLYELHLWRGNKEIVKKIIEGMRHLAVMTGIGTPKVAILVAEKLWEMCWQYVGPDEVPLEKTGEAEVLDCVAALATLAEFNGWVGHSRGVTDEINRTAEQFFQVSLWYGNKRICNRVIGAYVAGLKASEGGNGEGAFVYGRKRMLRSVRRVCRMLLERKPGWTKQRKTMDRALSGQL